jgi:hypothetical protein
MINLDAGDIGLFDIAFDDRQVELLCAITLTLDAGGSAVKSTNEVQPELLLTTSSNWHQCGVAPNPLIKC